MYKLNLRIKELRASKGISQQLLADALNVSYQTVSKWENGINSPDISMLPQLSDFFSVSVDALLGLVPIPQLDYQPANTDQRNYWIHKKDYLSRSRKDLWNEDYLEYLVKSVWNINAPVKILDMGCGSGALGRMLLPFLPVGSSYTGVDFESSLLDEARELFSGLPYETAFLDADLYTFSPKANYYDITITQAVLRHFNNPFCVLEKMKLALKPGGLLITLEVNRAFEQDGLYLDGLDYNYLRRSGNLDTLWENEQNQQGRDYAIGIRLPFYLKELGLTDIQVRMNDKVSFIHPAQPDYEETITNVLLTNHWDTLLTPAEKEKHISFFLSKGMSREKAEAYVEREAQIRLYFHNYADVAAYLKFMGLIITWGKR